MHERGFFFIVNIFLYRVLSSINFYHLQKLLLYFIYLYYLKKAFFQLFKLMVLYFFFKYDINIIDFSIIDTRIFVIFTLHKYVYVHVYMYIFKIKCQTLIEIVVFFSFY